jgi:uncharacterized protein YutE (UPF0331/DUF86 family)
VDDVVVSKAAIVERCVARVREVHGGDDDALARDLLRQDSIVLNLQRACEAAIDLAMHIVRQRRLGVPQESREAFRLLEAAGIIDADLSASLQRMVGFRNVAVHAYQTLDLTVVRAVVATGLDELLAFARRALALAR